jgi:hypothetical protein
MHPSGCKHGSRKTPGGRAYQDRQAVIGPHAVGGKQLDRIVMLREGPEQVRRLYSERPVPPVRTSSEQLTAKVVALLGRWACLKLQPSKKWPNAANG